MTVRSYKLAWLAFVAMIGIVFVAGSLNEIAWTVFGFAAFGLIFMGMMSVLPASITHPAPPRSSIDFGKKLNRVFGRLKEGFAAKRQSWFPSGIVGIHRPKLH